MGLRVPKHYQGNTTLSSFVACNVLSERLNVRPEISMGIISVQIPKRKNEERVSQTLARRCRARRKNAHKRNTI